MTWGEFKKHVEEKLGIREEDQIRWIDVNGQAPLDEVDAGKDKEGKIAIYT